MITVLFACVQNAGRSQIAQALFTRYANPSKALAISAGTAPGAHVHPEVIDAMRERGIDLTGRTPTRLTPELAARAQWLITMGCGDACPVVPGTKRDDWPLDDPKGQARDRVERIVDDIDARVRTLIDTQGWG